MRQVPARVHDDEAVLVGANVARQANMEAQHRMDDARNQAAITLAPAEFGNLPGITLADKGWMAYDQAQRSHPHGTPENHFRRLSTRAPEEISAWRAADRALAEMTTVDRGDLYASPRDRARFERATAVVRDSLLEAAQAAADAARRARAVAETLDEVLAALADPQRGTMVPVPAIAASATPAANHLSQREREVLRRVAAGHSNKVIAAELYVSPNTVKTHVASLLRKLNVHTRAQLATIAVQQGLG
jgi:DNA-binding CsgD family transcriptional regulator